MLTRNSHSWRGHCLPSIRSHLPIGGYLSRVDIFSGINLNSTLVSSIASAAHSISLIVIWRTNVNCLYLLCILVVYRTARYETAEKVGIIWAWSLPQGHCITGRASISPIDDTWKVGITPRTPLHWRLLNIVHHILATTRAYAEDKNMSAPSHPFLLFQSLPCDHVQVRQIDCGPFTISSCENNMQTPRINSLARYVPHCSVGIQGYH